MTKTQELQNYTYFGISNKGNVRENNEDAFKKIESVNGSFFVLCDGMGGVKGGDIAAKLTIESIEKFVSEEWNNNPIKLIKNAIEIANKEVFDYFYKKDKLTKPGTTIVIALIRNNKIYYAHVGDSRIYYQTGKKIFQITTDHSLVADLISKKIITEEEAKTHPQKNVITKAVGTKLFAEPTVCRKPIEPADGDNLLLCSDGLTNEITDQTILNVLLSNKMPKNNAETLIDKALQSGGKDNVTLQLINFYNTGKASNKKYKPSKEKNSKKYKKLFFLILFLALLPILIVLISKNKNNIKEIVNINQNKKNSLLIYKKNKKDTIVNVFLNKKQNLDIILKTYNLTADKIGHSSSLINNYGYTKYYIPVKKVYKYKVGKFIYSYPEINKNNIIDILIANNKQELYFKNGENIIVP